MLHRPILLSLLCLLTLSACGFHLKGTQSTATNIERLHLVFNDPKQEAPALQQSIAQQLKQQNIQVVAADSEAPQVIITNPFNRREQTATGGNVGDIREIELIDGFSAQLLIDGTPIAETAIASRTYIQQSSQQYLGSQEEESNAHHQLAHDNAGKLLRWIDAQLKRHHEPQR